MNESYEIAEHQRRDRMSKMSIIQLNAHLNPVFLLEAWNVIHNQFDCAGICFEISRLTAKSSLQTAFACARAAAEHVSPHVISISILSPFPLPISPLTRSSFLDVVPHRNPRLRSLHDRPTARPFPSLPPFRLLPTPTDHDRHC